MKKQKKEKGEFFIKIKNFVSKANEHAKEKKELKKVIKNNRPKGYFVRKSGVFVFWGILATIVLLLFVIISSVKEINANVKKDALDPKLTQSASEFGEQFLKAYLPIQLNTEGLLTDIEGQRKEILSYYATTDILDDLSKIYQDTHNIKIMDLSMHNMKVTNDAYLVTYKANMQYSTVPKVEEVDGVPVQSEVVTTYSTKYITVKLYLLDNGTFVVYELPSFEPVKVEKKSLTVSEKSELANVYEDQVVKDLTKFVNTFMDAFLRDTKEKISYLLTKDYTIDGFNETLKLNQIKNIELYKGASETEYLIYVTALVIDAETNVTFPTTYSLAVVNEKDTYLVKAVNDKSYVQQAIDYKIKIEEEKY